LASNDDPENIMHIAFDDTDSRQGRCTTHLAFKITNYLIKNNIAEFIDYPLLIRLNPNIPWKTRGNGAICLRIKTKKQGKISEYIKQCLTESSAVGAGANPGLAVFEGLSVPDKVKEFSMAAMFDVLSRQKAEKIAKQNGFKYFTLGNGQGLVGSLAAIGCLLEADHTYEAIAYRKEEHYGTARIVDKSKVIEYNKDTFPKTFNNYDYNHKRVLITPHGPDPVFCGIRGESPEVVVSSLRRLQTHEDLDGYMVFRSNQGTNMHLKHLLSLLEIKSYTAGHVICRVNTNPYSIEGGHVMFSVDDFEGSISKVAVYEPTDLTKIASKLEREDVIQIGVGVRKATSKHQKVLNIEYLSILKLAKVYQVSNPFCNHCKRRMKSKGKNQGFECDKCENHERCETKMWIPKQRSINRGLYLATPRSHRHLTKPFHRYGMEKTSYMATKLFDKWFLSNPN